LGSFVTGLKKQFSGSLHVGMEAEVLRNSAPKFEEQKIDLILTIEK
jgi:hypothetical protein